MYIEGVFVKLLNILLDRQHAQRVDFLSDTVCARTVPSRELMHAGACRVASSSAQCFCGGDLVGFLSPMCGYERRILLFTRFDTISMFAIARCF